jgi:hypothetical protein
VSGAPARLGEFELLASQFDWIAPRRRSAIVAGHHVVPPFARA